MRNWVKKAHNNLDTNNDVDCRTLKSMALYVARVKKYVFNDDSNEMEIQARDIPTKEQILPLKLKRSRD